MIEYCITQLNYYLEEMKNVTDKDYLPVYQGRCQAFSWMLSNLGYDTKVRIKLVKFD